MRDSDEIVDVDADIRDEIRKGKTPRKLFLRVALICVFVLMAVGIFVNYNNLNKPPENAAKLAEIKGLEAKEAVKPNVTNTVERAEKEQTESAIANVKGASRPVQQKDLGGRDTELERLRGTDSRIGSAQYPASGQQDAVRAPSENLDAIRQKREAIFTAGIFKGGSQRTSSPSSAQDSSSEGEMLRRLNQQQSQQQSSPQISPEAILGSMKPQQPKSAAQAETDFNAAMEAKKLNAPTGILEKTNNNCVLREGWLIPVANMDAMNSDQPGEITLVVRRNVYGSYNNHCLAIPAGTTIVATYNPNVAIGQERFNVAATVMQLPNGKRVPMAGTRAYDSNGASGIEADVNNHFFKIVGTSLMLGLAARLAGDDKTSTSSANGSTTTNSTVLGKTVGEAAQTILERNKNIAPTLTKEAAVRFNLKVSREFLMEDYRD